MCFYRIPTSIKLSQNSFFLFFFFPFPVVNIAAPLSSEKTLLFHIVRPTFYWTGRILIYCTFHCTSIFSVVAVFQLCFAHDTHAAILCMTLWFALTVSPMLLKREINDSNTRALQGPSPNRCDQTEYPERDRERANARRVVFIYRFTSWGKCYFFFSVTLLLLSYPVFFFFLLASSNFYFKSLRKIKRRKKSRRDRYLHHTPTEMYKYSRHCNSEKQDET